MILRSTTKTLAGVGMHVAQAHIFSTSKDRDAEREVGRRICIETRGYQHNRQGPQLPDRNVKLTSEFQLSDVSHTKIAHATIGIGLASDSQANIPAAIL